MEKETAEILSQLDAAGEQALSMHIRRLLGFSKHAACT
jgi:hypothetical protein